MATALGESAGRMEPTLLQGDIQGLARSGDEIAIQADAAYQRAQESDQRRLQETRAACSKLFIWIAVWACAMYFCGQAAHAIQPGNPRDLAYFFEGAATVLMLLVTFWRAVLRLAGWVIGVVIVLAIIKGAFLIVFTL